MKLVARSLMTWILPDVYTRSQSAPKLASVVMMAPRKVHCAPATATAQFRSVLIAKSSEMFFTHRSRMGICARRSVDPEHLYALLLLLSLIFYMIRLV